MLGGEIIREARLRAGLSQEQLARKTVTKQPVIARWESGSRSPSFRNVERAVRACGFSLSVRLAAYDEDHDRLIADRMELSPEERLDLMIQERRRMLEWSRAAKRLA